MEAVILSFVAGLAMAVPIGWLCSGKPAANWRLAAAVLHGARLCHAAQNVLKEIEAGGPELDELRSAVIVWASEYPGSVKPGGVVWL